MKNKLNCLSNPFLSTCTENFQEYPVFKNVYLKMYSWKKDEIKCYISNKLCSSSFDFTFFKLSTIWDHYLKNGLKLDYSKGIFELYVSLKNKV